jgi:hypothetical protein
VNSHIGYPASLIAAYLLEEKDFTTSMDIESLDLQQSVSFIQYGGDHSHLVYNASTHLAGDLTDVAGVFA